MNTFNVAVRNTSRNRGRTAFTIVGIAIVTLTFVLLRTVVASWAAAQEQSASDRIATRHKVTILLPLPVRYAREIRELPGVAGAVTGTWFGAKDPKDESDFLSSIATEPEHFLRVVNELELPPEQATAWKENRRGAIVGDILAKKKGWKVGDMITLRGTIYQGDWEFEVAGIYTSARASVDRSTVFFNWEYLNQSVPPRQRDQVGWIITRVADPSQSAQLTREIDQRFALRDVQTSTMSERAFQASLLGMVSTLLRAIDVASIVILMIMMLIVGNTIAMGVRERTREYGVLRAIGFLPRHVFVFILGEAIAIGGAGAILGLLISYPIVEQGIGRFLEENMGAFFPFFRIEAATAGLAIALIIFFTVVAALVPAVRASKLRIVDCLRHVA
jgi:putative ABC transport system permease protein